MNRQRIARKRPRCPRMQSLGVILWPSFVAASLACGVFFAFVDPLRLRDISLPGHAISRELGYTLGFFLSWLVTAASSTVTCYLLRPMPRTADDEVPLG